MGKNRDRLSIIAAILEAANSGASKTRIMFSANLSFKLLEKYLDVVIKAGFVRIEYSNYRLTEQGRAFLKNYKLLQEKFSRTQGLLEALSCERDKLDELSAPNGLKRSESIIDAK